MTQLMLTATLLQRLEAAWERSDRMFALLASDAYRERPIELRHPFIFYLGHLSAFAWNQVCRGLLDKPAFRPEFDDLFQRGIDPRDTEAPPQGLAPEHWPALNEIFEYRDRVRSELRAAYACVPEHHREHVMARGGRVFYTVLEHELMHHETLLYMLSRVDRSRLRPPADRPPPACGPAASRRAVRIPAGSAVLGARFDAVPFGWDNEFPQQHAEVPAFVIDSTPVTNGELQEFIDAGGYDRPELWTADGWRWQHARRSRGGEGRGPGAGRPACWIERDGELFLRTLFDELPLRRVFDWPVSVSWVEAAAFARWKGSRLPTEAEFHRAAYGSPDGVVRRHPWGEALPSPRHGNFDLRRWEPNPVGSHPDGASAFGVEELVGNGWEWTSTAFAPFAGFSAYMPDYPGYSADFFDGRHHVLLGASFATDQQLLRRSFRNWYQPHYPYVFSKFRCVRDA